MESRPPDNRTTAGEAGKGSDMGKVSSAARAPAPAAQAARRLREHRGSLACRERLEEARDGPTDEALHEWRKAVQHHWRHLLLLKQAWPEQIGARAKLAREVASLPACSLSSITWSSTACPGGYCSVTC
mgnify:CR=1 FL=1